MALATDDFVDVDPWYAPVRRGELEAPVVNSLGCRWFGLGRASPHLRLSRQGEFLEVDPPVAPPTKEDVESYGPDASIANWFISQWAASQGTPYPRDLYLMDLDIHTLPPIPLTRITRLHLARVTVKAIPQDLMDRLESLTINDCRELEWLPEIPKKLYGTLSITSCPNLLTKRFYAEPPAFVYSLYGGPPSFREAQRPTFDALVDRINDHMKILNRCRLIASIREDIIAEAFKPSRIERRINLYGIDVVMDSMSIS